MSTAPLVAPAHPYDERLGPNSTAPPTLFDCGPFVLDEAVAGVAVMHELYSSKEALDAAVTGAPDAPSCCCNRQLALGGLNPARV